jgi:cysteine-S-conjugate beta-lyase
MKSETQVVHAGRDRDPYTGASSIPIYQTSTFAQPDPAHPGPYDYSRSGNPTREALEQALAELEGGAVGLAFASGMAAISSVFMLFKPGDHIVVTHDVYGGTYRALTTLFARWRLDHTFVDMTQPTLVRAAIRPETVALFVETPANPLLQITDLRVMAAIAAEHQILAMVDNTFLTPYLQKPIAFGFDIVMHSVTKFLGGHSDLVAGAVVTRDDDWGCRLKAVQNTFGAILGPQDAWLTLRGIKTLAARMEAQQRTAARVAEWLVDHPRVKQVYFPGLPSHPGREINESQAAGPGAIVSFELVDRPTTLNLLKRVELSLVAVSLGGCESILSYPVMMSHAGIPRPERLARGITDELVRLSVGLEAAEDLIADLEKALND